jgi:hypothetical protein
MEWEYKELLYFSLLCLAVAAIFWFIDESVFAIAFYPGLGLFTICCFLYVNMIIKKASNPTFMTSIVVGIYIIAGLLSLMFQYSLIGYTLLVVGVLMVIYAFYLWNEYRHDVEEQTSEPFSTFSRPAQLSPKQLDDNDPLGVLPYADRIRPRTDGESKTSR